MMDRDSSFQQAEYLVTNNHRVPMLVISDTKEFNNSVIYPGDSMRIPLLVPPGLRHCAIKTFKGGAPCIWLTLVDQDAPALSTYGGYDN